MLVALSLVAALVGQPPPDDGTAKPTAPEPSVEGEGQRSPAAEPPKPPTGPDLEIGVAARVVVRPEFRSNTL